MRCPHCAGEIPAGSRFCGICGRNITPTPAGAQALDPALPDVSLFELPVSRGARRLKIALVLVLDAILAAAGIIMILSYLEARGAPPAAAPPPQTGSVAPSASPGAARQATEASGSVQPAGPSGR